MTDSPVTITLQQQYRGWPLQLSGAVDLDTIPELVRQFFKLHELVEQIESHGSESASSQQATRCRTTESGETSGQRGGIRESVEKPVSTGPQPNISEKP